MDRFQGIPEADARAAVTPAEVFDLARARRSELELDYAGAVTPPEAWLLVQQGAATLVDVRTARLPHRATRSSTNPTNPSR